MHGDMNTFPIRLKLKGCRADLVRELPGVYPDVWRSLCELAGRSHISIDLNEKAILQEGPKGWRPLKNPEAGEQLINDLHIINQLPRRELSQEDHGFAVIMLAGGTGSRFLNSSLQKVLYPVLGVPALERSFNTCQKAGARTIVLVVGFAWEEVFEFAEKHHPGCHFVYQPQPLGTGDAARRATWLLRERGFKGTVLILAGDKVLTPNAIPALLQSHHDREADMTLAVASKNAWPNSGRVVLNDEQRALSIIERPDVIQRIMFRRIHDFTDDVIETDSLLHEFTQMQPSEKKLRKALGTDLWSLLNDGPQCPRERLLDCIDPDMLDFKIIKASGEEFRLTPEQVEAQCDLVNVSLYLFSSEALYWAVDRFQSGNAQGEFYLTDAAEILTQAKNGPRPFRVFAARLPDDYDAAGFNTMQELNDIEIYMRQRGLS